MIALRQALESVADPQRAPLMRAYMRDNFEFLGISSAARREATRTILARRPLDWDLVDYCWAQPEREFQYVACDHLRRQQLPAADLPRVRALITTRSWWDTVDHLAKVAGTALAEQPNAIDAWPTDPNLWIRRANIISQLGLREATSTTRLARAIEANLGSTEFFINKAIGWALRDYARTDPHWVLDFANSHELAPLSRREALKHLGR